VLRLVVALAAASLVAPQLCEAQQTGESRVALATVLDPHNRPVLDVGADDFVIQEAGVAREVLSVRPADYPIVLLLDTGIDARGDLPMMRQAAGRFLERVGQRPIAIATFGGTPAVVAGLEEDRETVAARLAAIEIANAPSALVQGAALAADTVHATGALFSAIVVLSSSPLDATAGSPDPLISSIVESGAMLHVIANRAVQATAGGGFRPGAAMRALAEQSRGEFTTIYSAASFQAALDRLAERFASELMIEYLVPVGSKPRDVKLGVRLAGTHVRGLGVAPR
jgi:hypothetical protein